MSGRLRALIWVAAVVVVVVLAVYGLAGTSTTGRLAPALPRERLSGADVTLSSVLAAAHGRSVLVVFWASWCDPCRQEAPDVAAFARSAFGRGRIVGVDWSDPETSEARAFVRRYRWSFPNLRDREGTVGYRYRVRNMPAWFVVNTDGRIGQVFYGPQTERSLRVALG
jgi:thiol-disulfide isomerase/thioredoxin